MKRHVHQQVCLHVRLAPEAGAASADAKVGAIVGTIKKFQEESRTDEFFCYVEPGALFTQPLQWHPPGADLKQMYFMREHERGARGHLINTGFLCTRSNTGTLKFWRKVRKRMASTKAPDQPVVNEFIRKRLHNLPWAFIPEDAALAKHPKLKCVNAPDSSLHVYTGGGVGSQLYRKSVSLAAQLGIGCSEPPSGDLWSLPSDWKNKRSDSGSAGGRKKGKKVPNWKQKLDKKYEEHMAEMNSGDAKASMVVGSDQGAAGGGGGGGGEGVHQRARARRGRERPGRVRSQVRGGAYRRKRRLLTPRLPLIPAFISRPLRA